MAYEAGIMLDYKLAEEAKEALFEEKLLEVDFVGDVYEGGEFKETIVVQLFRAISASNNWLSENLPLSPSYQQKMFFIWLLGFIFVTLYNNWSKSSSLRGTYWKYAKKNWFKNKKPKPKLGSFKSKIFSV